MAKWPTCRLGQKVALGDRVLIEAVVESISPEDGMCGVRTEFAGTSNPDGTVMLLDAKQFMSVNTRPEEGDE